MSGRRRLEVRAIAIGFVAAGFLILIVRSLGERYFVNTLVKSDSVRPAAQNAFEIMTDLLKGAGWTAVIVGVVALAGVWLIGPGRRATQATAGAGAASVRRGDLRRDHRRLPAAALVAADAAVRLLGERLIFLGLLLVGTEVLRRQLAREAPAHCRSRMTDEPGWRPEPLRYRPVPVILGWLTAAAGLLVAAWLVPGVSVDGFGGALVTALADRDPERRS